MITGQDADAPHAFAATPQKRSDKGKRSANSIGISSVMTKNRMAEIPASEVEQNNCLILSEGQGLSCSSWNVYVQSEGDTPCRMMMPLLRPIKMAARRRARKGGRVQ